MTSAGTKASAKTAESTSGLEILADPLRWELLRALATSDRRVQELTELTGRPQNLVSYHLRSLRDAGLAETRRSNFDGRDTYYRVHLDRCGELFTRAAESLHPGLVANPFASPSPGLPTNGLQGSRPRVLFLCTGNSARSQIAEALLEHRSNGTVEARSAGSQPKSLHPEAVRVMAERGVDIADREAKHLRRFSRTRFDRVITLCDRVREVCPEFPHDPRMSHWSIPDPSVDDGSPAAFDRVADDLDVRIGYLVAEITAQIPTRQARTASTKTRTSHE